MTKYSNHDHYLDPETGVLKNKLGIADSNTLEKQETDYATARSYELAAKPITGKFDLAHLRAIHKQLFSDLYAWAGDIRNIDIAKGDSFFAHHAHIESAAKPNLSRLGTARNSPPICGGICTSRTMSARPRVGRRPQRMNGCGSR